MKKKKQQPRLHLDMPFGEAMARFAGVGVDHVLTNIKRAKQKKPPGKRRVSPAAKRTKD